jgi:hypothetical protein
VRERVPEEIVTHVESEQDYAIDWNQDRAGYWAVRGPGEDERRAAPREATLPADDLAALRLPAGDERVLVALRPLLRVPAVA